MMSWTNIYNRNNRTPSGYGTIWAMLLMVLIVLDSADSMAQTSTEQPAFNRKTLIKEVRSKVKATQYTDADATLKKAFKEHPDLEIDDELNFMEMNVQDKLIEAENRKIFLNNRPDTAKYFSYIYELYTYGMAISLDSKKYSKQVTQALSRYRNNLLSAGKFHYKKSQYAEAYKYLDRYLTTNHHPALTRNPEYQADTDTVELSKFAVVSAFGNKQYADVSKYMLDALADSVNQQQLLEIGAKSAVELKDTVSALSYMWQGRMNDPMNDYFCYSLLDYYSDQYDYSVVYELATDTYKYLPEPIDSVKAFRLLYIKGKAEEILQKEDSALTTFALASAYNPSDPRTYKSIGGIYLRKAHSLSEQNTALLPRSAEYKKVKAQLDSYYQSAATAFEKVSELQRDDTSQWLLELRECYYKLNKGKELKKLEQYE